jgi:hypothetical protein
MNRRSTFGFPHYFVISLVIGLITAQQGCTQTINTQVQSVQKKSTFDSVILNETFDVSQFKDHLWTIKAVIRSLPPSDTVANSLTGLSGSDEVKTVTVAGYRVQLYSTTDYYAAVRVRNEAMNRFTEEIIMDFEQPYYKIRIGNYTEKQEADEVRIFARSIGYPEAWVIQTKVTITKQ